MMKFVRNKNLFINININKQITLMLKIELLILIYNISMCVKSVVHL